MPARPLRTSLSFALAAPAFFALGFALRGPARSPDELFGLRVPLGTCLVFLGFLSCLLGWGGALSLALLQRRTILLRTALGTAFLALLARVLGELGLIGWDHKPLLIALLLLGPALDLLVTAQLPIATDLATAPTPPRAEQRVTRALQLGMIAVLALAALQAGVPDSHPDPLYYDLLGPRLWAQAGRFYLPDSMPILLQCTSWDDLGIWAHSLLGASGGLGLIEGQLFSQWIHAVIAGGGAVLALELLLRPFLPREMPRMAATLSGFAAAGMIWTLPFAKNDWGATFWVLAGTALLLDRRSRREAALFGVIFGLGLIAKLTTAFSAIWLLPLAIVWVPTTFPERLRDACAAAAGIVFALLPTFARNLAEAGSPVFPAMNRVFHSPQLTASWATFIAAAEGPELRLPILALRARLLWLQSPLVLGLLVPPLLWIARRKAPRIWPLWLVSIASFSCFAIGVGVDASLRLLGPGDLILCAVAAAGFFSLLETCIQYNNFAIALSAALGAAALFFSQANWRFPLRLIQAPPLRDLIRTPSPLVHYPPVGGLAAAWLRQHATPADKILSLEDDRLYYLSAFDVTSVREDPRLDALFREKPLLEALEGSDANLLLTTPDWRLPYRGKLDRELARVVAQRPNVVLFEADGVQVIALRALLSK